jgi:hypothetical protein
MGVPIRVTIGRPPAWFRYEYEEVIATWEPSRTNLSPALTPRLLAPPPRVFMLEDEQEFRRAYEQHLNAVGAGRLRQVFERLAQKHGGRRLVLLCFESRVEDCHRGQFAEWWERQTGQAVPELPERRATQEALW